MAKTKPTAPAAPTEQVPPTEQLTTTDQVAPEQLISSPEYTERLLARYNVNDAKIAQLQADYGKLTIAGPDDKETYKTAASALSDVRSTRTGVEARRKELKEPFLRAGQAIDAEAKRLTALIQPVENHLAAEIARTDKQIEERKRAEEKRRMQILIDAGFQLAGQFYQAGAVMVAWDRLMEIDEPSLIELAEKGKAELARIKEENDRIAKMKQEAAELEQKLAAMKAQLAEQEKPEQPDIWGGHEPHPAQHIAGPLPVFQQANTNAGSVPASVPASAPSPLAPHPKTVWFNDGFEACKNRIIKLFTEDQTPRKRSEWVEIFSNLKP